MPWHAPAKIKRYGHFCVFTGMWVFQNITLHRATNSAESQAKIGLAFHFVERNHGGTYCVTNAKKNANVICLPTEHLGVLKNSFRTCPCISGSNCNTEMLVFEERGKQENPEKNLSEQSREPTTNSTHIWRQVRESNPGHIGGRRALSPLHHPCSFISSHSFTRVRNLGSLW